MPSRRCRHLKLECLPCDCPDPSHLSGLMLIGFTIVAAPLLFAIVNAAVQMNRLSNRSEQLVVHGVQGTRNNQRMFVEIAALERTARLYQIIAATPNCSRSTPATSGALSGTARGAADPAARCGRRERDRHAASASRAAPQGGPAAGGAELAADGGFGQRLSADVEIASKISNRISAQIDKELTVLQKAARAGAAEPVLANACCWCR